MRATALQIVIQVRNLCPVSVIIGLVDDLVTSFHSAKLANAQILFKPLQTLQVFLKALDQVICERFFARVSIQK